MPLILCEFLGKKTESLINNVPEGQPNCMVCKYNGKPMTRQFVCDTCQTPVHALSGCSVNREGSSESIPGDPFRQCFTCAFGKH